MRTPAVKRRHSMATGAIAVAVVVAALPAAGASVPADLVPVKLEPALSGGARFGQAVSVSGDTLVVGAEDDDAPENGSGSAIVYVAADGGWAEQAKLVAPDGAKFDGFGADVAVDGDTVLVGEPYGSPDGTSSSGSAYVFVRSGTTWTQEARLVPSVLGTGSNAGWSVALQGDTALVGVPAGGSDSKGAVSIFTRSSATWTEQAVLQDPDLDAGDGFGTAVALDAGTLVVGQVPHGYVYGEPQHNAAYVYTGSGADWSLQSVLASSDMGQADRFGGSVDVDGDTVVVGAEDHSGEGQRSAGAAYVFTRSGSSWPQQAELLASGGDPDDQFGKAVSVDRKVILVSSYNYRVDPNTGAGGAVYVFRRSDTTWTQRRLLLAPGEPENAHFGYDVDLAPQPTGGRTLVSGAVWGGRSGVAFVYRWEPSK